MNAFTPFTYYQYLTDNAPAEIETAMEKQLTPTEAELQQVYEEYKDLLGLGTTYRYRIETADGTLQELTQNTREIGKTDTVTEDLIYGYFTSMQPGQSFAYELPRHSSAETTCRSLAQRLPRSLRFSRYPFSWSLRAARWIALRVSAFCSSIVFMR